MDDVRERDRKREIARERESKPSAKLVLQNDMWFSGP